jgi:hypothetical protein
MEADWEIEIGTDAPVIDGGWVGFIALRTEPARVSEIGEAARFPALAESLVRLNATSSPVWTAKCDVWPVEAFDPDELDADRKAAVTALGCYIDLLPTDAAVFSTLDACAKWSQQLCLKLRSRPLRQCRVDAIVRRAFLTSESTGLGVTTYITGCGSNRSEATKSLARALAVLTSSVLATGVQFGDLE